jgi:hypothetical protein
MLIHYSQEGQRRSNHRALVPVLVLGQAHSSLLLYPRFERG